MFVSRAVHALLLIGCVYAPPPPAHRKTSDTDTIVVNGEQQQPAKPQLQAPNVVQQKQPKLVKPPAHLDAVPLERDGKLNKKYREELFLGRDTNNIEVDEHGDVRKHDDTEGKDTIALIKELFYKADVTKRGKISAGELEATIVANIQHHLDESMGENHHLFRIIDQDGDGVITWEEYHYHFLVDNKLMAPEKAKKHDEQEHDDMDDQHLEKMELDRDVWNTADNDGKPGLNEQEFLAFRHPEHNAATLKEMVDGIIRALDRDNDGRLSEDEFATSAPGEVDPQWADQEAKYQKERRDEFVEIIDSDHDGYATQKELEDFVNPRNPKHAKQEVRELMEIADTDKDGFVSLTELIEHEQDLVLTGVLHPIKRLHEDL